MQSSYLLPQLLLIMTLAFWPRVRVPERFSVMFSEVRVAPFCQTSAWHELLMHTQEAQMPIT